MKRFFQKFRALPKHKFCSKCQGMRNKWHRHYELDKDDPQYTEGEE